MKTVVTETKQVQRAIVVCDFCGKEPCAPIHGGVIKQCYGCGKDACMNCSEIWFQDPFDGVDMGDYPLTLCKTCDNSVQGFLVHAKKLRADFEAATEKLEDEWRAQLNAKKTA